MTDFSEIIATVRREGLRVLGITIQRPRGIDSQSLMDLAETYGHIRLQNALTHHLGWKSSQGHKFFNWDGFIKFAQRYCQEREAKETKAKYSSKSLPVKYTPPLTIEDKILAHIERHCGTKDINSLPKDKQLIANDLLDSLYRTGFMLSDVILDRQANIIIGTLTDAPPESKTDWRERMLKENKFEPYTQGAKNGI